MRPGNDVGTGELLAADGGGAAAASLVPVPSRTPVSFARALDLVPALGGTRADGGPTGAVPAAEAYEQCRLITRTIARTFYYGSRFLPLDKRRAAWALYAFCRTADDIADAPGSYPQALGVLAEWRLALVDTYAGRPRGPVMSAWANVLTRFPVPLAPALELLAGVASDVVGARYETFDDLRRYCYRVAGTVGLLMAPILGYQHDEALHCAVDLGIAMQLTNILRDVGEDAARGRIYLPEEDLARFGYSQEELRAGALTPAFVALIEFEVARAEEYYRRGLRGVRLLSPDARLAIVVSAALYRGILRRIRRNHFDVFVTRAHVPLPAKLGAVPGAWLRTRLARR